MEDKLVIWGAGGHALVVADIVRLVGKYKIVGLLDDINPQRRGTDFFGYRVLGGREVLDDLKRKSVEHVVLAFGDSEMRLKLAQLVAEMGYRLATVVHPRAILASDIRIDAGTVVAAGAVINPGTVIGSNVIVNTSASIDHNCFIQDGAHIGPGARLAGGVLVKRTAQVGIGSVIARSITVGANALIGAGAVVLDDIPDGVVAYGVPARVVRRSRENG
jgi:acetyltransferase EpsM